MKGVILMADTAKKSLKDQIAEIAGKFAGTRLSGL